MLSVSLTGAYLDLREQQTFRHPQMVVVLCMMAEQDSLETASLVVKKILVEMAVSLQQVSSTAEVLAGDLSCSMSLRQCFVDSALLVELQVAAEEALSWGQAMLGRCH